MTGGSPSAVSETASNTVDSANPNTVYQNSFTITNGTRCYKRFTTINSPSSPNYLRFLVPVTLTFAAPAFSLTIQVVNDDWDPTTLTWNNKPSSTAVTIGTLNFPSADVSNFSHSEVSPLQFVVYGTAFGGATDSVAGFALISSGGATFTLGTGLVYYG